MTDDETDDDHLVLGVYMGAGRWFVLERSGDDPFRLVAGPYQTEAAVDRWMDGYAVPVGVDLVVIVRCEGTWQDAIPHVENALVEWKRQLEQQGGG